MSGALVISLDFELYWGTMDHRSPSSYRERILGARRAVREILGLFSRYDIHATWAVVGFTFFGNRRELAVGAPRRKPAYSNAALDPYRTLSRIGEGEHEEGLYFAPDLIDQIRDSAHQEIGTHTFS